MRIAGEQMGLTVEVFSTPTSVTIGFGEEGEQHVVLIRVQPDEINLSRLIEVDAIGAQVGCGELTASEGTRALRRAVRRRPRFDAATSLASVAVASGCAARFFNGGWNEIWAATILGFVVGAVVMLSTSSARSARLVDFLSGFIAATLAWIVAGLTGAIEPFITTLAAVIVLIPGLSITVAVSELSTRNLVSGTARLTGAITILLLLAFGVAVGGQTGAYIMTGDRAGIGEIATEPLAAWTIVPTLIIASAAFVVIFHARWRDYVPIVVVALAGFFAARAASTSTPEYSGGGVDLAALAGGFTVALLSNAWSRLRDLPSAVTALPGLILLVPGSIGMRGVTSLLADDLDSGVATSFKMLITAVSLVAGLLIAHAVYPSRKSV